MTLTASFYYVFFVFSLFCCKYSDIYLSILDFNGLCKFSNICIYKITEDIQDETFSSSEPKKANRTFLYEMV